MSTHAEKNPNPQGKGVVPLLSDWRDTRPAVVAAKAPAAVLLDWFSSALVLSASFRFKPVVGQCYHLYARQGRWQLSLVAPREWRGRAPGDCLGECRLRPDMTWQITPDADLDSHPGLRRELQALVQGFLEALDSEDDVAVKLPGYRRELPYYQRLLATGLGTSLRGSLSAAGVGGESARQLRDAGAGALQQALAAPGAD